MISKREYGRVPSRRLRSLAASLHRASANRRDKWADVVIFAAFLLAWMFVGILNTVGEIESYNTFFFKASPTFRILFRDPYASYPLGAESEYGAHMDGNGDWLLNTPELNDYLAYCRARYGVDLPDPIRMRALCRGVTRSSN